MEKENIEMFLATNASKFPSNKISLIKNQLEKIDDSKYLVVQTAPYKSATNMFIISLFLGGLGVDRFMLGHVGAGILKLFLSMLFIPWFIDLFLISKATKERNFMLFTQYAH